MWLLWHFWEKVYYVYSAITTWWSDAVLAEFILNKYRKSAVGHCFPPKSRGQPNSVQLHCHSQQVNCGRGISAKALVPLETKTRHLEGSRTIQLLLCSPEGKIFDFFIWPLNNQLHSTQVPGSARSLTRQSREITVWQFQFICTT